MSIYLVTNHQFNHEGEGRHPIDPRFTESEKNYTYYLIDKKTPKQLMGKKVLHEERIDPLLYQAGGKHFGEWSFLLAEEKHAFCSYPFFMVSSRFYEKNSWLKTSLDEEWDTLFSYLKKYGWGYLPSYDRPLYWVDLSWKKKVAQKESKQHFWPFHAEAFHLIQQLYNVEIPKEYHFTPFLFCNYIGFSTREHFLEYVNFYKPLISYFFDETYTLNHPLEGYLKSTGQFRNEKPFTFLLELFSHLFFYKEKKPYFALHYHGYYLLQEGEKKKKKIRAFPIPFYLRLRRWLGWYKNRLKDKLKECFNLG
ncbi:MAG: hypothetical protein S4CHLAM45_01810 [Chlamydiales bacterium]|nr:hypothetical protein [Chlamydiales bacterium]MCH9619500.1 hypothetical protein [Chlamydiales bacterium]MCH9622304.1 hypothetical protein [Chlamydiales bacterium]